MPVTIASWQPRNPLGQSSGRYHRAARPIFSRRQDHEPAGTLLEGTIRRNIRGFVSFVGGTPPFSWTRNAFDVSGGAPRGAVTSPENFMISTRVVLTVGNQRSNPLARPIYGTWQLQPTPPLVRAGNAPGRPSVRERIVSLGSRVPPLNSYGPDSEQP